MIPSTPAELIDRAQHCLRTGQPRMARLYMRNASAALPETLAPAQEESTGTPRRLFAARTELNTAHQVGVLVQIPILPDMSSWETLAAELHAERRRSPLPPTTGTRHPLTKGRKR